MKTVIEEIGQMLSEMLGAALVLAALYQAFSGIRQFADLFIRLYI